MAIPANLRRQVVKRATNCCEYCGLAQTGQEATFHVDHVVPVVDGGQSTSENLALAFVSCSLRKGARLLMVDPHTGEHLTAETLEIPNCSQRSRISHEIKAAPPS
jgi:5-methylcytosine-specific restriction endonuclease McrA